MQAVQRVPKVRTSMKILLPSPEGSIEVREQAETILVRIVNPKGDAEIGLQFAEARALADNLRKITRHTETRPPGRP